ncbi:hypothetical protein Vadar_027070 [Vaccinium darrowii]|uniref:Uncharacterized protein n=1 Tax=Vaccinium darrowii TaxID=229202 RepID=A0ACB7ZED4_9ERIC|nr:hypothetical protein Vadar_027070 [Vaccinium darrowii]
MEFPVEFAGSNDQYSPVMKHKRAKRKTPLSLLATTVTSSSSTGGVSSGNGESCFATPSPTSSGNNSTNKDEDEDEDMANCLILLAQGGRKSDLSLFDCKTCNRTFPSFQALGGHRASHKKPKGDTNLLPSIHKPDEFEEEETKFPKTNKMIISPPFSFPVETKKASLVDNKSSKVHGCSICGVVFSSGQALGGHMRRHRAPPAATETTARISTSDDDEGINTTEPCEEDNKPRKILHLDLNLPAPFEDDFEFIVASKRRFVLSAPALVDCYY